jgi:ribonuclease Z
VVICGPKDITKQVQSKIQSYCWKLIAEDAITYEIREIADDGTIKRAELKPPFWNIEPIDDLKEGSIFKTEDFQVDYTVLDHKTQSVAYLFKAHDTLKINIKNTAYKGGKWINQLKEAFQLQQEHQIITIEEQNYKASELFHLIDIKKGKTLGVILDHAASFENHEKIKQLFFNTDTVLIESFYKTSDKVFAEANYHSYSSASGAIMKACNVKEAIPVHFSRKYKAEEVEELITEFNNAFE